MSQALNQSGYFRAAVQTYGLSRSKQSAALGVRIAFQVQERLCGNSWEDFREYDCVVFGTWWVVKKDGTINERAVKDLVECLGWDGQDLEDWTREGMRLTPCQITVKERAKDAGRVVFEAAFMRPWNWRPNLTNLEDDELPHIVRKYGSHIRAAAANAQKSLGHKKPAAMEPKKIEDLADQTPTPEEDLPPWVTEE